MTIINEFFGVEIECDNCSNYYDSDSHDFSDAIAEIKELGWYIRKKDGVWEHFCPTCKPIIFGAEA